MSPAQHPQSRDFVILIRRFLCSCSSGFCNSTSFLNKFEEWNCEPLTAFLSTSSRGHSVLKKYIYACPLYLNWQVKPVLLYPFVYRAQNVIFPWVDPEWCLFPCLFGSSFKCINPVLEFPMFSGMLSCSQKIVPLPLSPWWNFQGPHPPHFLRLSLLLLRVSSCHVTPCWQLGWVEKKLCVVLETAHAGISKQHVVPRLGLMDGSLSLSGPQFPHLFNKWLVNFKV